MNDLGRRLGGRYLLEQQLGGGGTAVVYRARDLERGLAVAVKELRPQFARLPAARRRFLREAEIATRLTHPGIVRVLDAGEDAGRPFLVMELVDGETLRALLARVGPLDAASARKVVIRLAEVLAHAHARGVIHRDLKPENVFVVGEPLATAQAVAAEEQLELRIRLGDFGQARITALASLTGSSVTWGTPEYMAPEVFARGRVDPRSDLYGLGVMLHELLTGRLPWNRAEALTRLGPARKGVPVALPPTGAGARLDAVIADLLAPLPEQRPESGLEVISRLHDPDAAARETPVKCLGCDARMGRDLPFCLACGQQAVRFGHTRWGVWRLVLHSLRDDPETMESLLDLLAAVAHREPIGVTPGATSLRRPVKRTHFLTEARHLYSRDEQEAGIPLPAVLFEELDEATALGLEALFRAKGLDVEALGGQRKQALRRRRPPPLNPGASWVYGLIATGTLVGVVSEVTHDWVVTLGLAAGGWATYILARIGLRRSALITANGYFRLRGELVAVPAADDVLARATAALARVQVPEVRALYADVAAALHRLARGAGGLQGGAAARVLGAAPALGDRLAALAERLDAVDAALAAGREGELLQALGRIERQLGSAPEQRADLDATRGRLEDALAQRQHLDEERDQLSTTLCLLLGRLREACRAAEGLALGPVGQDAALLHGAMDEIGSFLALAAPVPTGSDANRTAPEPVTTAASARPDQPADPGEPPPHPALPVPRP